MSEQPTPDRLAFEDLVRTEIYLMTIARKQHAWDIGLTLTTTLGALVVASISGAAVILGLPTRLSLAIAILALFAGTVTGIASIIASVVGFSRRAHMAGTLAKECALVLAEYRMTIREGATHADVSGVMKKLANITAPIGADLPYNEKVNLRLHDEARTIADEEFENGKRS